MKESLVALSVCVASVCAFADMAKVGTVVIDEKTQDPIEGATVKAWFQWNIGWRAWSEPTPIVIDTKITDKKGFCRLEGKTNVGEVGGEVQRIPGKSYSGSGNGFEFRRKDLFGVWQPDNLVATIRLPGNAIWKLSEINHPAVTNFFRTLNEIGEPRLGTMPIFAPFYYTNLEPDVLAYMRTLCVRTNIHEGAIHDIMSVVGNRAEGLRVWVSQEMNGNGQT